MPIAQLTQAEEDWAPVPERKVPGAQGAQLELPVAGWYLPAKQLTHTEAPAVENLPAAQISQSELKVAEVEDEYLPAAHELHAELCLYFPAGQKIVQAVAPTAANHPEPQPVQPVLPVSAA